MKCVHNTSKCLGTVTECPGCQRRFCEVCMPVEVGPLCGDCSRKRPDVPPVKTRIRVPTYGESKIVFERKPR